MAKDKPTKTHCLNGHRQNRRASYWNGRSWSCKRCKAICVVQGANRRRAADPLGFSLAQLRRNAKKRGLDFSLVKEDLLPLPTHCPVLGVELDYSGGGGPNVASVDRIDSTKGYLRENVAIISKRANTLKNNASVEELQKVLDYLRSTLITMS